MNKSGDIRKYTDNKPVYTVSVDQLQSYNPELVPQLSGKITSAHIWAAQVMVDHFGDSTYVQIFISTIQKKTLSVKPAFGIWAAKSGVKVH